MFSRPWRHLESHKMHGTWQRAFIGNMPLTGNDNIEHFKAMLLHSFLPNKFNLSLFSLFRTKWCTTQSAPIQEIPLADVGHFKGQTTKQTSNCHITLLNFKRFTERHKGTNEIRLQIRSHEYKSIQMHQFVWLPFAQVHAICKKSVEDTGSHSIGALPPTIAQWFVVFPTASQWSIAVSGSLDRWWVIYTHPIGSIYHL